MTDTPQPPKGPRKKPDVTIEADKAARAKLVAEAAELGIVAEEDWPIERIEDAMLKAMVAEKAAEAQATAEPPKPAPKAAPAGEDPDARAEVIKACHEAGMDLEDLKGRPLDEILSMLGKFRTEQIAAAKRGPEAPAGKVKVRVLKKGDNKISKGIHVPGTGDLKYKAGEKLSLPRAQALELQERGFVELED